MEHLWQHIHHYFSAFDQFLHVFLRQHPNLGELFAFVVAFTESLPIIGTIVPGSVTMTLVGTMIGAGLLPAGTTFTAASVGAFAGDSLGFWVGRKFDNKIRHVWPFTRWPQWLTASEAFFEKHGGKSIIIGRFVGPVRSTVPMVAGLLKLSWWRFAGAAIPSAIAWAIVYMVPGIVLGALALEMPPQQTTKFIVIGLVVILLLWLIFWAIEHFFSQLCRVIDFLIDKLWAMLQRHRAWQWMIKLIHNRQNPNDHHQLTLVVFSILSAILFLVALSNMLMHNGLVYLNDPVFHLLQSIRVGWLDHVFVVITLFGKPLVMTIAAIVVIAGLILYRKWQLAAQMLALLIITSACVFVFKHLSHSLRPTGFMVVAQTSSFPSGHTTLSFVILSFLAFISGDILESGYRWISYTLASILIVLVACSRLYLGAHWITDIIGSALLGLAVLLAMIASYRRFNKQPLANILSKRRWFSLVAIALIVPWLCACWLGFSKAVYRYTPFITINYVNINAWWNNPLQYTPVYRNSRFGNPNEPFNIQWAGHLRDIKKALQQSGWLHINRKATLQKELKRMTAFDPRYHLPILPSLYIHEKPQLIMYHFVNRKKNIAVLRLWHAYVGFYNDTSNLWIGTLNIHKPPRALMNEKEAKLALVYRDVFSTLQKALSGYQRKIILVAAAKQPKKIRLLGWDGKVLVVK